MMASIVHLTNGLLMWTTDNPEQVCPCCYDASKCVLLVPKGQNQLDLVKLSDDIGKPTKVTYGQTGVMCIRDCNDEDLNAKCRSALSGLVLVK
jgi:hypothetical protein